MKKYLLMLFAVVLVLAACTNGAGQNGPIILPGNGGSGNGANVPDDGVQIGNGDVIFNGNDLDSVLVSIDAPTAVALGEGEYSISASTFAKKISSLKGAGEKTVVVIEDAAAQSGTIDLEDNAAISNLTLKIGSEGATQAFSAEGISVLAATETGKVLLNAVGDGVVFDGVHIEVVGPDVAYNVIQVLGDGFTFKNGSITGVPYDSTGAALEGYFTDNSYSSVNMGIVLGSTATSVTISESTFKGNYTPVYTTSPDFTMTNLTFDSGIELETVSDESTITGCKKLTNEEGYVAKINIATKAGSLETDYDLANTVRDKFAAANSVEVRINDHSVSEIQTYYGGFGTQRFLGNLYVGMLHGADAKIKVDSAKYSENTDEATVKVVFDLEDYNYVGENPLFTGDDITLEFHGGKKDADGNFTATSVTINGSGTVSDNAEQYRKLPVTFTDVEVEIGTDATADRGVPFVFLNGTDPCVCDFATGVVQYVADKHAFQIPSTLEGIEADF